MLNGSNDDCSDISYTSADGDVAFVNPKDLQGNKNVRMRAKDDSNKAIGQVVVGAKDNSNEAISRVAVVIDRLQPILKGVTLYLSTFSREIDNSTSESSSQDEYLNGKRCAESWLALSLCLCYGADHIPSNCFSVAQDIVQYLTGMIEIRLTEHVNQIDNLSICQVANIELPDDIVSEIEKLRRDSSAIVSGV